MFIKKDYNKLHYEKKRKKLFLQNLTNKKTKSDYNRVAYTKCRKLQLKNEIFKSIDKQNTTQGYKDSIYEQLHKKQIKKTTKNTRLECLQKKCKRRNIKYIVFQKKTNKFLQSKRSI